MPLKIERELGVARQECVPRERVLEELGSHHRTGESNGDNGSSGQTSAEGAGHQDESHGDHECAGAHWVQDQTIIFYESGSNDVASGIGRFVDLLAPPCVHEQEISAKNQQSADDQASH
jgi:hypothetical protein